MLTRTPTTCSPSGIGKMRASRDSNLELAVHLIRYRCGDVPPSLSRKTLRHRIFLRATGVRMIWRSEVPDE